MGWIDERPQNTDQQVLEFAATGRLIDLDARASASPRDKASTILIMVLSSVAIGIGATLAIGAMRGAGGIEALIGFALITVGLSLLLPAIRLVRIHAAAPGVEIRPGAVLPPELIRTGNWIHRGGAWVRVEQIGRDGGGNLTALLSTGDVIELSTPVTIAGGSFRPVADPVASLRR